MAELRTGGAERGKEHPAADGRTEATGGGCSLLPESCSDPPPQTRREVQPLQSSPRALRRRRSGGLCSARRYGGKKLAQRNEGGVYEIPPMSGRRAPPRTQTRLAARGAACRKEQGARGGGERGTGKRCRRRSRTLWGSRRPRSAVERLRLRCRPERPHELHRGTAAAYLNQHRSR